MKKFVQFNKMSKKKQKEENKKKRNTWNINPVSRISKSVSDYKNKKRQMKGCD